LGRDALAVETALLRRRDVAFFIEQLFAKVLENVVDLRGPASPGGGSALQIAR